MKAILAFLLLSLSYISSLASASCSGSVFAFYSLTQSLDYSFFCIVQGKTILTTGLASTNIAYAAFTNDASYCSSVALFSSAYFASSASNQCVYFSPLAGTFYTTFCSNTTPFVVCIGSPPTPYSIGTFSTVTVITRTIFTITQTTNTVFAMSTNFVYISTTTLSLTSSETVTSSSIISTSTLTTRFTTTTSTQSATMTSVTTSIISFLEVSSNTLTESFTDTVTSIETAIFKTTISTTTTTSSCPITSTSVVIIPTSTTFTLTNFDVLTVTELVPVATTSNCNLDDDE